MKIFVIGDIHGQYDALCSVLSASGFRDDTDRLIGLGDVYDGPFPEKCIERLLKIRDLVTVVGNNDLFIRDEQVRLGMETPETSFLMSLRPYYIDDGRLFIHGGFDPHKPFQLQDEYDYSSSRHLPQMAWRAHQNGEPFEVDGFREVYVGHTRTQVFGQTRPFCLANLWMMDTGAAFGRGGFLSLMDVGSKQFWQSPTK